MVRLRWSKWSNWSSFNPSTHHNLYILWFSLRQTTSINHGNPRDAKRLDHSGAVRPRISCRLAEPPAVQFRSSMLLLFGIWTPCHIYIYICHLGATVQQSFVFDHNISQMSLHGWYRACWINDHPTSCHRASSSCTDQLELLAADHQPAKQNWQTGMELGAWWQPFTEVGVYADQRCWPCALSNTPWIDGSSWISCTFPWKTTYLKSSACNHRGWMWLAWFSWNNLKHNSPWQNCSQPWTSDDKCIQMQCIQMQCPWMKPVACARTVVDFGPRYNHCFNMFLQRSNDNEHQWADWACQLLKL